MSWTTLGRLGLGSAAIVACCVPGVIAQKTSDPISVGYRFQVFVVKQDGGARRLTGGQTEHWAPAWSPNGRRIAMSAGLRRIEVRDVAGRVRHEIRGGTLASGQLAWAPDGRRVAFVTFHRHTGKPRIVGNLVVTSQEGSDRRIVATRATGRPAWSADGTTLYYLHGTGPSYSTSSKSLWSVPARGGTARRIVRDVYWNSKLLLSPNGRWLLFERSFGLWIIRASDGGGLRRVIGHRYFSPGSYGWAPGGEAIYGGKHKNHPIVTSLGGSRSELGVRVSSSLYAWSPDGERVAWVDNQVGGHVMRVLSARPDGTGRRVVARFTSQERVTEAEGLEWSPRGRRFALVPFRHVGD